MLPPLVQFVLGPVFASVLGACGYSGATALHPDRPTPATLCQLRPPGLHSLYARRSTHLCFLHSLRTPRLRAWQAPPPPTPPVGRSAAASPTSAALARSLPSPSPSKKDVILAVDPDIECANVELQRNVRACAEQPTPIHPRARQHARSFRARRGVPLVGISELVAMRRCSSSRLARAPRRRRYSGISLSNDVDSHSECS